MLLLRFGSLNGLADKLSEAPGANAGRVYPHRLQALLADDAARGVNTATLEMLERASAAVEEPKGWAIAPDAVRSAVASHSLAHDPDVAIRRAADDLGVPAGVVRAVVASEVSSKAAVAHLPKPSAPDWSWQQTAVSAALASLRRSKMARAGLIIPTGGGKTRVALNAALTWLNEHPGTVLWVTHRRHLERQARRTLHALVREAGLPQEEAAATFARVRFVMTTRVADEIHALGERLACIIVDEAHHAAAASYESVLSQDAAPVLLLTATPNRADALPIGLTDIAYETTYRELFERRCLIEPIFDPPEEMPDLDWDSVEGLYPLAEYLLDRAETDFAKPMVAVSQRDRAEMLYEAVIARLDARGVHPLTTDEIGYVHGGSNSHGLEDPSDFLDEFSAKPAGILIATSQLVGEGMDDPAIDAAILTYPSTSIAHLMQVAGRALRFAPGKTATHVVQIRQSAMEYHFEQRWLYQDISDQLRPELLNVAYTSPADLAQKVTEVLAAHLVAESTQAEIVASLANQQADGRVRILLSGIPYFGALANFGTDATWGAILVAHEERPRFLGIFNDISIRTEDLKEQHQFLKDKFPPGAPTDGLVRSYAELIPAMEYARREMTNVSYGGATSRPYRQGRASTWLKYVTFEFKPVIPAALETFLADAFNRVQLLQTYADVPEAWALALRLELPVSGSEGFLLNSDEAAWFRGHIQELMTRLGEAPRSNALQELGRYYSTLGPVPVPQRLIAHIAQFLRPERVAAHQLALSLSNQREDALA